MSKELIRTSLLAILAYNRDQAFNTAHEAVKKVIRTVEMMQKSAATPATGQGMKKFTRVDLKDVLEADTDGMPVFRKCFEHETLMSFYDDEGNYSFREWWEVEGAVLFNKWLKDERVEFFKTEIELGYIQEIPATQPDKEPERITPPCRPK